MVYKTREIVTGKYVASDTYCLYKEDGSLFLRIEEGKGFTIGGDPQPWYPILENTKRGRRKILVCYKFGDTGKILDSFPLVHNKKGLWALTHGSAQSGVFFYYREPKTPLEEQVRAMNLGYRVIKIKSNIDVKLQVGGPLQKSRFDLNAWGFDCITDGKIEKLTEPIYAPFDTFNENSSIVPGSMLSTYMVRVYDATYVIHYSIDTFKNHKKFRRVQSIIVTEKADINTVISILKELDNSR